MVTIRLLPEFTVWLESLKDEAVRSIILARIRRMGQGLAGDVAPVGGGISELRIHVGSGWRVYFTQQEMQIVVVLCGGSKRTQRKDILRARKLAAQIV